MTQAILDAVADAGTWKELLARLPESLRDVYFGPEYAALHCFTPGSRALMFAFQDDDQVWLYPFILRPVPRIGDYLPQETWFDIESPYGYGGPLASTDAADFCAAAHRAFTAWCQEERIVAEFVRLHPLIQNQRWLDPRVELVYDRPTVSLNLANFSTLDISELPFDQTSRYMLGRARRSAICVEALPAYECMDKFSVLYRKTMERRGADVFYYFNEQYLRGLGQLIDDAGCFLAAKQGDQWVGAAVFLFGADSVHYHLSASDATKRLPGATNLILYEAARLGSDRGLSTMHLGGGVTAAPDDSLLRFKKSMGTNLHSFYVGKRIHNRKRYARLRNAWEKAYPSLVAQSGHKVLCYRIGTNE